MLERKPAFWFWLSPRLGMRHREPPSGARHIEIRNPHKIRRRREAENCVDLDALLAVADTAPPLSGGLPGVELRIKTQPRIAVARDEAFCFYYEDNLRILEKCGAALIPFSPLRDKTLPENIHALYLGGGYPELYAKALSENVSMLGSIRNAVSDSLPTLAECGGYLYLLESLEDEAGVSYPMAGAKARI